MQAVQHVEQWYEANKDVFAPPICNKLMHKDQLTIMFVGGPNTRTDFHLDEGSEFFYMLKGNMELPTIQQGKLEVVKIKEGEVFCLPSRIPHSPQRPEEGSLGLVIERKRNEDELDGLRWYTDFEDPKNILWERFFHCGDLGRDLVPVVQAYKSSDECKTGIPTGDNVIASPPVAQDCSTKVPPPFSLKPWIEENREKLSRGEALNLFGANHPDKEFKVLIVGGESSQTDQWENETWLFQIEGGATVTVDGETEPIRLEERCCGIVPSGKRYTVRRDPQSIGMVVTQDPAGNKK